MVVLGQLLPYVLLSTWTYRSKTSSLTPDKKTTCWFISFILIHVRNNIYIYIFQSVYVNTRPLAFAKRSYVRRIMTIDCGSWLAGCFSTVKLNILLLLIIIIITFGFYVLFIYYYYLVILYTDIYINKHMGNKLSRRW